MTAVLIVEYVAIHPHSLPAASPMVFLANDPGKN
jgi:hypothetical protein